jgi:hypothetical protein
MDEKPFPIVDIQLLEALKERFPNRCPSRSDSYDLIKIKIGHQEVIDFLEKEFKEQNENILDRKVT